jgi:hypothetical protein
VLKNQDEKCIVEGTFEVEAVIISNSFFRENDLDFDNFDNPAKGNTFLQVSRGLL